MTWYTNCEYFDQCLFLLLLIYFKKVKLSLNINYHCEWKQNRQKQKREKCQWIVFFLSIHSGDAQRRTVKIATTTSHFKNVDKYVKLKIKVCLRVSFNRIQSIGNSSFVLKKGKRQNILWIIQSSQKFKSS